MATSPSHRWGQIIAQEFLEVAIEPLMSGIATTHRMSPEKCGLDLSRYTTGMVRVAPSVWIRISVMSP
jgi:hypothetical protein